MEGNAGVVGREALGGEGEVERERSEWQGEGGYEERNGK